MLPEEPTILLSFVNMKLRDEFSDLDDMCDALDIDKNELIEKLEKAGFRYDEENHFFK
ncbi:MAG: DUF4250 domain-containing protein [Lachnospiraceae bacterium]|nr:DUF4250 domain-containing protein [Lachnospiraceae bacterium]